MGCFKHKERERKTHFFKRTEPESEFLKVLPNKTFHKHFFARYGDEIEQNFDDMRCSVCGQRSSSAANARTHLMSHFDSNRYTKFYCERCQQNYPSYNGISGHANCGKMGFAIPNECRRHFISCVRFAIECPKCGNQYSKYSNARHHYERECKDSKNEHRYYKEKINAPDMSEKEKEWSEEEMMEFIRAKTLPKLRNFAKRFPPGALMLFGQTEFPKIRDAQYNMFKAVYRRDTLSPFMDINEQFIFECWSRFDALLFEFLIQRHTIDEDGEFYAEFGAHVNQQEHHRPTFTEEIGVKDKPYYCYIKMTKKPWVMVDGHKGRNRRAEKKMNELPSSSQSTSSDNSSELPSSTISEHDSDAESFDSNVLMPSSPDSKRQRKISTSSSEGSKNVAKKRQRKSFAINGFHAQNDK